MKSGKHKHIAGFTAVLIGISLASGACKGEAPQEAEATAHAWEEGTVAIPGEWERILEEGEPSPELVGETAPSEGAPQELPLLEVATGQVAAPVGRSGGTLSIAGASLEVPEGALGESVVVELKVLDDPEELERPLPGSTHLAVLRGTPWNLPLARAARLTVTLNRELEPGTPVELLSWQPQMRAFMVSGVAVVDASGRATFPVRMLGSMLVRARPVAAADAQEYCPGDNFVLKEAWPSRSEEDASGLTPVEARIPRELAFNLLSDFRLSPFADRVDFKNEEVDDSPQFRADVRNHQDEDFLMDPNAAAALTALVAMVDREWIDPLSGEPAVRVRVTEAYDSLIEHSARSSHYQGRALDLTVSPVPAADGPTRRQWYGRLARLAVCAGFDWVYFENSFHLHVSVVPTEFILVALGGAELQLETGAFPSHRALERLGAPLRVEFADTMSAEERSQVVAAALARANQGRAAQVLSEGEVLMTTVDGLRQIVVQGGRAWLVNTRAQPPIGSVGADGQPVDIEYPFLLSPPDAEIQSASFQPHERTQEAFERHVGDLTTP